MVSNTRLRSLGELLMMPRTWEVAFSRSSASLSSREITVCRLDAVLCCFSAALRLRVGTGLFLLLLAAVMGLGEFRRSRFTLLRGLIFPRGARLVATHSP